MKTIFLFLSLLIPSLTFAENEFFKTIPVDSGASYDFKSGNNYRWDTDTTGTTRINGNNYNTGTIWNTTVDKDGSMRGQDSKGNFWNYNERTGTYMNYGTGEIRNKRQGW